MNNENTSSAHAVLHIDSVTHLDIRFHDEHTIFAFGSAGIIKGGEIALTHNRVRQMLAAIAARQNWQSDTSGTTPYLLAWWDREDDQLNIDLIRLKPEVELFGRVLLENPNRKEIIDAINNNARA